MQEKLCRLTQNYATWFEISAGKGVFTADNENYSVEV